MSKAIVAVDAMGGDLAPDSTVLGAVQAARRGIAVTLVGFPEAIHAELNRHGDWAGLPIQVAEAPETIQMSEAPLAALRRKPRASVRVAANLAASDQANALFSAGHTGATLLSAHGAFGVLDGVERPALAVTVPTRTGAALLLDSGANVDCRPEHLAQFAVMGAAYARVALQIERPKVGLLSIGEEAGKGNDLIREAHVRLQSTPVEYIGNLEAREFFTGRADVKLMQAATGRIFVKTGAEGVYCGAVPELGLGIAIKCDDGAGRGAEVLVATVLAKLLKSDTALSSKLMQIANPPVESRVGAKVGTIRPTAALD